MERMILKHAKKAIIFCTILAIGITQAVFSQTNTLYDFNTAGQLSTNFNGTGSGVSSVTESATGGIGNTRAVSVPLSSVNAIYATKDGYSVGPVGSTYRFESFVRSEGSPGYSGMGFTTSSPSVVTGTPTPVYRPDVALGVSVHGSGFIFHNNATNYNGYWNSTLAGQTNDAAIQVIKSSICQNVINANNTDAIATCASPTGWYKIVLILERVGASTFDMTIEVWLSDANGTLINSANGADAILKLSSITNTTIANASIIHSYFNFSGIRFTKFDNYSINLSGGATVVQQGAPVVLTSSTSLSNQVVTVNGNVTSENGSTVTERGFVYGTSTNPTISNNKVAVGSGTGTFTGNTPTLAAGTYYFRTYATNSIGTSYGAEEQHTVPSSIIAPTITSFTPTIAGNGETVVITGTGFTGATAVKFGNVTATSFVVDSDTQITAVVGAAASGNVYVQNSAGSDTEAGFVFKIVDYNFNGNVLDVTDANLDGTINGGVTYGPGVEGQAVCFDRSSINWIKMPDDLIRNLTDFTISLRFKTASKGVLLGYQNNVVDANANQYIPIIVVQSDGKLRATLWTTANTDMSVVSTSAVNDGNWHKVDMSITPTSINIYIDGVLAGSTNSGTVAHLQMSYNQIGRGRTDLSRESVGGDLSGWQGFTGCIDNFIILDKGQSLATINEVTQLPQPTIGSFSPTTAKSGETVTITGTNLNGATTVKIGGIDVRSFTVVSATEIKAIVGKDASVNNTVAVITAGGTVSSNGFTFSCSSNSFDFDGVDDYIQVGAPLPLTATDNFTIEAWVKPNVIENAYRGFFGLQTGSGNGSTRSPSLWVGPNGSLHSDAYNGSSRYDMIVDNFFTVNQWTHVAYVKNGSTLSLYKNGVLVKSRSANSSLNMPNQNFWIGKVDNYLSGSIDEVRVWNVARTAQQISENFTVELVGNETGLKAYYNFNQGTAGGSNAAQASVNNLTSTSNLNGTVTSAALSGNSSNYVLGYWPLIMTQPAATLTACKDATTGNTLSVSAVGNKLTYQWYSNSINSTTGGTAINNATSASFTVPTSTTGTTYYYVVVSNDCNSGSVTSNISTVSINALPEISYGSNPLRFERTKTISSVAPTSTGATANNYTISPTLPQGLAINVNTGVISGTPSTVSATTTYTVTARTASGCTSTASFSIEVFNAVAPSDLTFSPATQTVRLNAPIANMVPSASGDPVGTYAISPALPAGLSINPATGVISGTLTAATTGTITYTITATNTGGSTTSTITLVYNTAPTNISVSPSSVNENATVGTSVGSLSATDADAGDTFIYTFVSGNGSTDNNSFTITGSTLKTAAIFDFETKSSYSVRIKVTDAGGLSFEKSFTITVNDLDNEDTDGDGIEDSEEKGSDPANPIDTDGDGIPDFKDTDADNDGVPDSVEITEGTSPTDKTKYKDSDGDGVPDYVETQNGTDPNDPKQYEDSDGDGVPDYIEILDGTNPNSAVNFKDSDGGGVPDYVETKVFPLYNLPATDPTKASDDNQDTDGDGVSDYAEIKAGTNPNDAPANLSFNPSSLTAEKGTAIKLVVPGYEKGKPTSYSISPALPAGLTMDPKTGIISGTPTVLLIPAVTYTITATNNGGSTTATFTLGVNDMPPSALKLTPATQLSEQGKAITTMTPSSAGGPVVSYAISPALPAGLTFNTTTGVISGTRTQAITGTVTYTITATNSGGSTTSTVTFTYNSTPTDIATTKANIYEGNNIGDVIGVLSTTDVDNPETHTYTLVMSGTNAFDNKNFKINGNRLVADTTFNFAFKNTYTVRIRSTDSQGLFTEKNFTISISKRPVIYGTSSEAYITVAGQGTSNISTTPVVSKGYSSQLDVQGDNIRTVSWSPGTGLSSTTSLRPVFKNATTVNYVVTVTNIFGSSIDIPFTVTVKDDYFIKPSNIITTRKDGINDYFTIENIESYPDNEITIYDRNGKILTKISNYNNRWDGKVNGQFLSNDTYYYLIRFTKNAQAPVKGFITIINN